MAMNRECPGYEAEYLHGADSVGGNRIQSDQAENDSNWPPASTLTPHSHALLNYRHNPSNGYLPMEPGVPFLSDFGNPEYLEPPLIENELSTVDSGYYGSTQRSSHQNPAVPDQTPEQQSSFQALQSYPIRPSNRPLIPYMLPSSSPSGGNVPMRKRDHSHYLLDDHEPNDHLQRSKLLRVNQTPLHTPSSSYPDVENSFTSMPLPSPTGHQATQPATWRATVPKITSKQKRFIRKWYEDFVKGQGNAFLAYEDVIALATLVKAPPHPVNEYIHRKFISPATTHSPTHSNLQETRQPMNRMQSYYSPPNYSLKEANQHLPKEDLRLVENYVIGCQRRRAQKDGRRRVNEGPFKCTFGCGYRTKRPYDWRRHEEPHEPQELWLCYLCRQKNEQNPFLVNRKDKFLKHAKDAHKQYDPEDLFGMSKVDFHAHVDPKCPLCPEDCTSWDDRCKHILAHYEDDVHANSRRTFQCLESLQRSNDTTEEERSDLDNPSESSDSSGDEDGSPDNSKEPPNRQDPTGGSGGGSGYVGGPPTYRDDGGQGHGSKGSSGSYNSYSDIGYAGFSVRDTTRSALGKDWDAERALMEMMLQPSSGTVGSERRRMVSNPLSTRRFMRNSNISLGVSSSLVPGPSPTRYQPQVPLLAFLGQGSHGSVDTVQEYVTGRVFARKRSKHRSLPREVNILKSLTHPHIVKFVASYTQNSLLNLVLSPVAQLTLREFLCGASKPEDDIDRIHTWVGCLSSALAYIHARRIRHADIKPHNILLRDSAIFISDFGISRIVSEPDSTSSSDSPNTPLYAPLEIAECLPHGRKADIFSLGCVVLEILTRTQGQTIGELHDFLGFTNGKKRLHRNAIAYYRVQEKLLSWVSLMQQSATTTTWRLWNICKFMLQNRTDLRPSASLLLEEVRKVLEMGNFPTCHSCDVFVDPNQFDSFGLDISRGLPGTVVSRHLQSPDARPPMKLPTYEGTARDELPLALSISRRGAERNQQGIQITLSNTCLTPTSPILLACRCACTRKEKRSSPLLGLFDILNELEQAPFDPFSIDIPNWFSYAVAFQAPPAYDCPYLYPVSISSTEWATASTLPRSSGHAVQLVEITAIGKIGSELPQSKCHETQVQTPRLLARGLCHKCRTCFEALRLQECRNCSHIRCEKCTVVFPTQSNLLPRKADCDLAEIGSHLLPPAYSLHDSPQDIPTGDSVRDPLAELHTENAVLDLVIAESEALGNNPRERFIQDRPSTFDRIHSPVSSPRHRFLSPSTSITSGLEYQLHYQLSDIGASSLTSSTSLSSQIPQPRARLESKQARAPTHSNQRISRRKSRRFISGRSKQTIHIKQQRAMNDHTNNLDSRELTSRLNRIKKTHSVPNDGDLVSRLPRMSESRRSTSSDSSVVMSRLPIFRRSHTSSTSNTNEASRLEVSRAIPPSHMSTESVQVDQGESSKPQVRRRRESNESSKSQKEFHYYGRHANSWLFNDFSLTGGVKKGWGKVFQGGKNEEE